jgi:soluble lytic murein transglycosylase
MKRLIPLILFCFVLMPASATLAGTIESQNYRHAFALLDSGHAEDAVIFAEHGRDEILNNVLRGAYYAHPGNDASFDEIAAFISRKPDWPNLKGMLATAETKIPTTYTPQQVTGWFAVHPPVSLIGFYRYVDALNVTGQTQHVSDLIHDRWINNEFTADELTAFAGRFSFALDRDTVWARLDRLLWKNDIPHAREVYPFADADMKTVAEARIALANQTRNVDAYVSRVPDAWQNDPGLLFERLRWYRKENKDDAAIDILRRSPESLGNAEVWWDERNIMIHRKMQERNYFLAYDLAAHHGQTEGKTLIQAEFLAGWLALRFLNDPEKAHEHFEALYDHAYTPISRARGAYWLGRTSEAANDPNTAEQYYENAATFAMTYYGQLATAHIEAKPTIQAAPEPAIPPQLRSQFYDQSLVQAAEKLARLGEHDRARIFFRAAMTTAAQRIDFAMLTELAYRIGRPDLAIETAKAANQKNMMIAAGGYPMLDLQLPHPPEPALIHALIRQESMFYPDAESTAGARGLMQLLPSTAKGVAKKLGLRFKAQHLNEPSYNLTIGAHYIQSQIDAFDGSYILAIAGYNAGPGRVREWIAQNGDPRHSDVDPVDWIESIPVAETRNYVQRVIENLQIYRARLSGGTTPLLIINDIKR